MEDYKSSGKSLRSFAEEKGILVSTLHGWLKEEQYLTFGAIEIKGSNPPLPKTLKSATNFALEKYCD